MPENAPPTTGGHSKKGRYLAMGAAGLVALVLVLYFVLTSAAFFKSVIAPKVGESLGGKLTVADASISPFSSVTLMQVRFETTGEKPLVQADEARLRYNLKSILAGDIVVSELTLVAPKIEIIQNADGTSNLDPVMTTLEEAKKAKKPKPDKPDEEAVMDVRNVNLKNANIRLVQHDKDGTRTETELGNVNVSLDQFATLKPGKLSLEANIGMDKTRPASGAAPAVADQLRAVLSGDFAFTLDKDAMPKELSGKTTLNIQTAKGAFSELAGLGSVLACELTPTEIRQLSLNFTQSGKNLGRVHLSGPLDPEKLEGRLKLEVAGIDKNVLNLAGAAAGIDFGSTVLNSTNEVVLEKNASLVSVNGGFFARQFSIKQDGATTQPLDFEAMYDLALDQNDQTALIKTFTLTGTQNQRPLLRGALTRPMKLALGGDAAAVEESAFGLAVTDLNLADWKAFIGEQDVAGRANATLNILSRNAGQNLSVKLDGQLTGLSGTFGSNRVENADANLKADLDVARFDQVSINDFQAKLAMKQQPALTASGKGAYVVSSGDADITVALETFLAPLTALLGDPDITATSGALNYSGRVVQKTEPGKPAPIVTQTITGKLTLNDFTGGYADYRLQSFGANIDCDLSLKNNAEAEIRKLAGTLNQAGKPGGSFDVAGNYNLDKGAGKLSFKADGINQNVLGPILSPMLGEQTLVSASLTANGNAAYNPAGESAIKGEVKLMNFLVNDPEGRMPGVPLDLQTDLDVLMNQPKPDAMLVQIRKLAGAINRGGVSGGKFDVTGNYDSAKGTGQFTAKVENLNETGLQPFLAGALEGKKLESISLNVDASGRYDAAGESSIKADVQMANLLIKDPQQKMPKTPLDAKLKLDTSMRGNVVDLRQVQVNLTPTERAKNQLNVTGRIDLTKTNATRGNVKIQSESFDVTPYYELVSGDDKKAAKPAETTPSPVPAGKPQEPEPIILPFEQFVLDVDFGRLFLKQIAISNLLATTKIDGGKVLLKPFQLTLSGAPVNASADLDLSAPGYRYDVSLNADKLPLQALVNTLAPDYQKRAAGDFFANIQIKGQGTTGTQMRQHLNGNVRLDITNASIQLVESSTALPQSPLSMIMNVPQMFQSPGDFLNGLIAPIAMALRLPEVLNSPLNYVHSDVRIGSGKIDVNQFLARSEAVLATSKGSIPIADDLMQSPVNQPVDIALSKALAKKFSITGTAPENPYDKLPDFVQLTGTIGDPKVKIDKAVTAGLVLKSVGGLPAEITGKAGGVLKGIGNILTGDPGQSGAATNAPPSQTETNKGPLDIFKIIPKFP